MLNREKCFNLLSVVNQFMREMGADYFISNGTLLGIWRSGDFFEHDNDIDIGVFASTWKEEYFEKLVKIGFVPSLQFGEKNNGLEYSFVYGDVKLDIFFYYEMDKFLWHAAWASYPNCGRKRQMLFHTYDKFATQDFDFKGLTIKIPTNPERCLEQAYGPDWRIPNKDWVWSRDPYNMIRKDIFVEYIDFQEKRRRG